MVMISVFTNYSVEMPTFFLFGGDFGLRCISSLSADQKLRAALGLRVIIVTMDTMIQQRMPDIHIFPSQKKKRFCYRDC